MDFRYLLVQQEAGIRRLTLNRPERLNALNVRVGVELLQALVRQAKLGASCQVQVLAEEGLTNHSYRVWQLWRKHEVKPNDTGEAYTGHHVARRGARTPQSLRQPRKIGECRWRWR